MVLGIELRLFDSSGRQTLHLFINVFLRAPSQLEKIGAIKLSWNQTLIFDFFDPLKHNMFNHSRNHSFTLKFNAHAKFDNSSTIQDYDSSAKSSAKSYSNHDQHSNDRDYTYFQSKAYERQIRSQIQQNRKKSATQKFIKIKKTKMSSANRSKTVQQFHKTIEQRFKTHKIDNFKACPAYQQGYSKRMPRNKVYDIYKKDFGGASSRVTQLLMHQSYLSIGENGNVGTVKVWRDEGVSSK